LGAYQKRGGESQTGVNRGWGLNKFSLQNVTERKLESYRTEPSFNRGTVCSYFYHYLVLSVNIPVNNINNVCVYILLLVYIENDSVNRGRVWAYFVSAFLDWGLIRRVAKKRLGAK
jgi:hypothetical protein